MRRWAVTLVLFLSVSVSALAQGKGRDITIPAAIGTTLDAYVVGSDNANKAVLLLHDRWGPNMTMRRWADRFAERGYYALVIDVFDGRASDEMGFATDIMNSVDPEWIKTDVVAGLKYLQFQGREIVTVGAGLGGWQSFQAALLEPDLVDAAVVIYGEMTADVELARSLKTPILGIFATNDLQVTQQQVDVYAYALKKSLTPYRIHSLSADHGFIDPLYPSYDARLADDAWIKVDRFLDSLLGN